MSVSTLDLSFDLGTQVNGYLKVELIGSSTVLPDMATPTCVWRERTGTTSLLTYYTYNVSLGP